MFRYLATDLDGTLLTTDKRITPYSEQVLLEAQRRGLRLILASGRPPFGIRPFAEQLQLARYGGFLVSYNGSLVWDCARGCAIRCQTLPMSVVTRLADYARDGFDILGYRADTIVSENTDNAWGQHIARINRMPFVRVPDFLGAMTEAQNKVLFTGNPRRLWHLERRLNRDFAGQLSAYRSEKFLLEVVPPGIDKAEALAEVLRLCEGGEGVTDEQGRAPKLICCGDGFNDVPMMRFAGLAVATRNAQQPVRDMAGFITDANDQDGVAHAVERFFLSML